MLSRPDYYQKVGWSFRNHWNRDSGQNVSITNMLTTCFIWPWLNQSSSSKLVQANSKCFIHKGTHLLKHWKRTLAITVFWQTTFSTGLKSWPLMQGGQRGGVCVVGGTVYLAKWFGTTFVAWVLFPAVANWTIWEHTVKQLHFLQYSSFYPLLTHTYILILTAEIFKFYLLYNHWNTNYSNLSKISLADNWWRSSQVLLWGETGLHREGPFVQLRDHGPSHVPTTQTEPWAAKVSGQSIYYQLVQ